MACWCFQAMPCRAVPCRVVSHLAPDAAMSLRMPAAKAVPDRISVPLPNSSTSTREDERMSDSTKLKDEAGQEGGRGMA